LKFLPKTKFGKGAVVGAALFAVVFALRILAWTPAPKGGDARLVATAGAQLEHDGDNDGLKDWEESLWRTSPNNPDSDGDGTRDGDEVREGRDPTTPAPDDALEHTDQMRRIAFNTEETLLTKTDQLGRILFSDYIAAKQAGIPLADVTESLLAKLAAQKSLVERTYTTADMTIGVHDDATSLHAYGNRMASIFTDTESANPHGAVVVFTNALRKKDREALVELDPFADYYRGAVGSALALAIPPSAREVHTAIINSHAEMAVALESMRTVFNDPIRTLSTFGQYPGVTLSLAQTMRDVGVYLRTHGVIYSLKDPGYALLQL
jgi:hypothetical protein